MAADTLNQELQEEYKLLQGKWDDFDRRAQTIRGWFVAGAGAAIGFSGELDPTWAPIALAGAGLNVWIVEAVWKSWQHAYGRRLREIEKHFRGEVLLSSAFQIEASWLAAYKAKPGKSTNWCKVWDEFRSRSVAIGYAPFVATCLIIALYQAGYIAIPPD